MFVFTKEIYERLDKLLDFSLFAWLMVIEMGDDTAFYLTANNESILHDGHTYQPYPMKLGPFGDSGEGNLPTTTVTLSNIGTIVTKHLEDDLWDQAPVFLLLIYKGDGTPGEKSVELLRWEFTLQAASTTHKNATLVLGQPNYLDTPFPPHRFLRETIFKAIPRNIRR